MTGTRRWAALAVVFALVAGCSSDSGPAAESTTTGIVTTTTTVPPTTTVTTTTPPTTPVIPTTTTVIPTTTTVIPTTTAIPTTVPITPRPAWPFDFPDPFVHVDGDGYHAYATTSGLVKLPRLESSTLTDWAGPTEALPTGPTWADAWSEWAPALLVVDGAHLLYYTARLAGTDTHCISVAESATADGPFVDRSEEPLLCPQDLGGAIDPSPFVDDDGTRYLLWKNDGVTLRRESSIWIRPLSADGRSFAGEQVRLIDTDQDWEYPHIEAPSMLRVDGTYWLAYSGNWWNQAAYGIGFARCASPIGPCEKPFDGPIVASRPGAEGPGGGELFLDLQGRSALVYHAWLVEPGYPGHRALWVADVGFGGDRPEVRPRPGG